jgi:PD-(D/E)XK nuclease superfamily/Domain of unknown function (DUF2357)
MAAPPTSEPRFLALDGRPAEPREWTPFILELPCPGEDWMRLRVWVNDRERRVFAQCLTGRLVVGCDWPEAAVGYYRLRVCHPEFEANHTLFIPPAKVSMEAVHRLLEDLHGRLPHALAVALQRGGGLAGLKLLPPEAVGISAELDRLSRIVRGEGRHQGLTALLAAIARDPHRALRRDELLTHVERVRRPTVGSLRRALYHQGGRLDSRLPLHLADQRVEPTFDVYENRVVRRITDMVDRRLRRLDAVLERNAGPGAREARDQATTLRDELKKARRRAAFLDEVRPLERSPQALTMVLLRRPEYRGVLAIWQEMVAGCLVELDDASLDAPFENIPYLYELWATLVIVLAMVEAAEAQEFKVLQERLIRRVPGSVLIEALRRNEPVAVLQQQETGAYLRILPQRSFGRSGPLQSVSFEQVPDLAVEFDLPGGETEVYLFDPKYKFRVDGDGVKPVKEDIDKMHAYRDAIISAATGERVVRYAAILYPGPSFSYGDGIAALSAHPEHPEAIRSMVLDALADIRLRSRLLNMNSA